MKYRSDIDGLRSFAVLSVLFFHINSEFMPGGFTGVDIFFVISGFLISTILMNEITTTSKINFKEFYRRRIRRILPSFFLVALVSSFLALLFLLPEDLVNFAKSLRAALTFTSNHYFADKDDYFDPNSDEFPLLHTWSLSVEEQFYFIWPLMLLYLLKVKTQKKILGTMVLTIIASTALAQIWLGNHKDAQRAYFFLFSRFGELLIGGLTAYLVSSNTLRFKTISLKVMSFLGMGAILASFYMVNKKTPFPGVWTLLPCLGSAFLLYAGHYQKGFIQNLLSLKPLVWIGLHSYAIYLWHWPLLAFYRYLWGKSELNFIEGLIISLLSIGLSVLSRKLIEIPINHSKKSFKEVTIRYFGIPSTALMALAVFLIAGKGVPERIADLNERKFILNRVTPTHKCHSNYKTDCWNKKDSSLPKALIIGDSHGAHFTPFVRELLPEYNVYAKTTSGCPAILRPTKIQKKEAQKNTKRFCLPGLKQVNKVLAEEDFKMVFLAGRWSSQKEHWTGIDKSLVETIKYLKNKNIQVYFMHEMESFNDKEILRFYRRNYGPAQMLLPKMDSDLKLARATDTYRNIAAEAGATVIKVAVPDFHAPFYKNLLIYRDGHHLTKEGSEILGREMRKLLAGEFNPVIISSSPDIKQEN